jgi:hypothetical protein
VYFADCMRRSGAAHHYAVRRVKNDQESIVRERIASAMLKGDGSNFWADIKRIRGNKASTSQIVDGLSGVNSIAQLVADKYHDLCLSILYYKSEMRDLINDTYCSLTGLIVSPVFLIFRTLKILKIKIHLKQLKSDGCTFVTSDCSINAGDELMVHLAPLLNALLVHGTAPDNFHLSTVVRILKGL